jgi:hypothetical protein
MSDNSSQLQTTSQGKLSTATRLTDVLENSWVAPLLILTNAITLVAFGLTLYVHLSTRPVDWVITSEVFKNFGEALLLLLGGLGAYYRFLRGRVFKNRLELSVSGRITCVDRQALLIVSGTVKNLGGSDFKLKTGECTLQITLYRVEPIPKSDIGKFVEIERICRAIFPEDELIESGETLKNERLIPLYTNDYAAAGLELFIPSARKRDWYTSTLVEKPKEHFDGNDKRS